MSRCKHCCKLKTYQWREKNPEKWEEHWKRYSSKPEVILKSRIRAVTERTREINRKNHNPETKRKWRLVNRDKTRFYSRIKHAKRRMAMATGDQITPEQWDKIKHRQNFKCIYCKKKRKLTMDHVIPLSLNGSNSASNIVAACKSCNCKKHATSPELYAKRNGLLFI